MAKDPYKYFRIEARELLASLGRGVADLEGGLATEAAVAGLLRSAHTLKGAARVVRCPGIAEQAHAIEELLEPHRRASEALPAPAIAQLFGLLDAIRALLAALDPASEPGAGPAVAPTSETMKVELTQVESLFESAQQVSVQLAALHRALGGISEARLQVARLKAAGVTLASDLGDLLDRTEQACLGGVARAQRDIERVRVDLGRLRLVEAGALAEPLEAAAKDAARALGKSVNLKLVGASTRLDAHVLWALRDALLHVVRNAVVHGLETGEERVAAGKSATGDIRVRFERVGQRVRVTCEDDGRGIDPRAVRQAAVRRGVLAESAGLSREEALQLVLEKGISTSFEVTELSGRGVGMDVVRDVVRRLKGSVSLSSEAGRGTAVTIHAPVSLFSVPMVVASVGGRRVAVPQEAVVRVESYPAAQLKRSAAGHRLELDGTLVPFLPLASALGWSSSLPRAPRHGTALIVKVDRSSVAVGIDRALQSEELIVVPLPDTVPPTPMISGVSFDADGNPELVLDPAGLIEAVRGAIPAEVEPLVGARLPLLVVDDSLTTRMLEAGILESAGYEVDLATSGEEGLEMASRRRYGLFIVDVEMPGMDGFEFLRRSRADPVLAGTPAILVTSLGSPEHRRRGSEAGARAYIVKSQFEQEYFLRTIAMLTGSVGVAR